MFDPDPCSSRPSPDRSRSELLRAWLREARGELYAARKRGAGPAELADLRREVREARLALRRGGCA